MEAVPSVTVDSVVLLTALDCQLLLLFALAIHKLSSVTLRSLVTIGKRSLFEMSLGMEFFTLDGLGISSTTLAEAVVDKQPPLVQGERYSVVNI